MAMSHQLAMSVALVVLDEIGPEKGEKLLNSLENLVIISKAPESPKQSVIRVKQAFLILLAGMNKPVGGKS